MKRLLYRISKRIEIYLQPHQDKNNAVMGRVCHTLALLAFANLSATVPVRVQSPLKPNSSRTVVHVFIASLTER